MVALPAEALLNVVLAKTWLSIVIVPASVDLRNVRDAPDWLVTVVMPDVLALTMSKTPSLVTAPTMLPRLPDVPSCSVAQAQIVVPPV